MPAIITLEILKFWQLSTEPAEEITLPSTAWSVAGDLRILLESSPGIYGLSAPQIGRNYRLILWKHEPAHHVLVNPEITCYGKTFSPAIETCYSCLAHHTCEIPRYERIEVQFWDLDLEKRLKVSLEGATARLMQHLIDHLNGRTMLHSRGRRFRKTHWDKWRNEMEDRHAAPKRPDALQDT